MRTVLRIALAVAVLAAAHSVQATQSVFPAVDAAGTTFTVVGPHSWSTPISGSGGETIVFYGRYTSDNAAESGLGLKVQYDPAKFTSVVIDPALTLTKCMVFTPDTSVSGQVLFGWADTSQRVNGVNGWAGLTGAVGWTGVADDVTQPCINPAPGIVTTTAAFTVPTTLFKATATTAAGFHNGSSTITFTATSASSAGGTAAFTNTSLAVIGPAPPCNLDMDGDGFISSPRDGVLLLRAMNPGILDANIFLGVPASPGSPIRTDGAAVRTYLNSFAAGLGPTILDVDGSSTTTAPVDGNAIKRALNPGIVSANITIGLAVTAGTTGSSIRTYLNNNCGTSLTP